MKGKNKTLYLGTQNLVSHSNAPDWSFIYETSLVKDAKWNLGDSVAIPGRGEFVYAKSGGACSTVMGAKFTATGYTAYTAFGVSASKGDKEITIPAATHSALTEDELRGGVVVIWNDADSSSQVRGIVGNQAVGANLAFKIQLDGPLSANIVAATAACETYQNPYAAITQNSSSTNPVAGVPAVKVSAASTYFWLQISGFIFVNPQAAVGTSNGGVGVCWRHDGSIEDIETSLAVTVATYDTSQIAGHVVMGDATNNGPIILLK